MKALIEKCELVHKIYDNLCVIEDKIINEKLDLYFIDDLLKNAIRLTKTMRVMPKCILIKKMQIFQLLQQYNDTVLDSSIKEFNKITKKYEKLQQSNLFQESTQLYEISKAYIFDYALEFEYIALSPNQKYLLVGTKIQVYIYDILTKVNIKVFKVRSYDGIFSINQRQIILITIFGMIVIDINTGKKSKYMTNYLTLKYIRFIKKKWLYIPYFNNHSVRIAKIDLQSNHQIFSLNIPKDQINKIQIFEDIIIFQANGCLQIFNEKTRKSIKIQLQGTKELFLMNKNEILQKNKQSKFTIFHIDYQNKILVQNKILNFSAKQLLRGNPSIGYFYLISDNRFQIIDENYNSIYMQDGNNYNILYNNPIQINSDRMFIICKIDGIYILKRIKHG